VTLVITRALKGLIAAAVATTVLASGPAAVAKSKPDAACIKAAQDLGNAAAESLSVLTGVPGDSKKLDATIKALQGYGAKAPAAIRSDLKTVTDAYVTFATKIAAMHITPAKASSPAVLARLAQATSVVNTPKVNAAVSRVNAWFTANCLPKH
jgi:hypothetical protein